MLGGSRIPKNKKEYYFKRWVVDVDVVERRHLSFYWWITQLEEVISIDVR